MMDTKKYSLVKAANILNIPFHSAKQMLFVFGSPRRHALLESQSPQLIRSKFKKTGDIKRKAKLIVKHDDSD